MYNSKIKRHIIEKGCRRFRPGSQKETTMINEDTIYLLRECNAGTQMAVYSIGEILENVKDPEGA